MFGNYKIIGVCLSTIQQENRKQNIKALNQYAVQNGYRLMIFNACADMYLQDNISDQAEGAVFQLINYDILDAMILFSACIYDDDIVENIADECRSRNIPLFTIDKPLEGSIHFTFSYFDSFETICRHVIETHHCKRVFMMAGMEGNGFSEQRVDAFRKVVAEYQIPPEDSQISYGNFWGGPTTDCMKQWFEIEKQSYPDAIICANDTMAIVVSKYLQDHGCRVPEDCIVTGFDGITQINYHIPHMTTCSEDYDEMAKQLFATLEAIRSGQPYEKEHIIPFHISYSASCGCEKVDLTNINDAMQEVFDRFTLCKQRQDLMCRVQSAVTKMSSLSELPSILIDKFVFHTIAFAVNDDIFRAPKFGLYHKGKHSYSDTINVLYQRVFWNPMESNTIKRSQLIPHLEKFLEREEPLVVCALHFMDLVLGYCVFQMEIDFDEYEKMHAFMISMGSSLGIFHSQMHVKSINMQLKSINDELEKLYIHDHLTGLFNRRGFYRQFRQQLEDNKGKNLNVAMISVDLDGLKYINDTFGHIEGDNAIVTVSRGLLTSTLQDEICSRFGGDEFTIAGVISDANEYFENFKTRFLTYIEEYNQVSQKPYRVEASIGFCVQPLTDDLDLDQMSKIADDRMYENKVMRKKNRK